MGLYLAVLYKQKELCPTDLINRERERIIQQVYPLAHSKNKEFTVEIQIFPIEKLLELSIPYVDDYVRGQFKKIIDALNQIRLATGRIRLCKLKFIEIINEL